MVGQDAVMTKFEESCPDSPEHEDDSSWRLTGFLCRMKGRGHWVRGAYGNKYAHSGVLCSHHSTAIYKGVGDLAMKTHVIREGIICKRNMCGCSRTWHVGV